LADREAWNVLRSTQWEGATVTAWLLLVLYLIHKSFIPMSLDIIRAQQTRDWRAAVMVARRR